VIEPEKYDQKQKAAVSRMQAEERQVNISLQFDLHHLIHVPSRHSPVHRPRVFLHLVEFLKVASLLLSFHIKVFYQIRDVIIIVIIRCTASVGWPLLAWLDGLVRLCQLTQ
jgi:hypothetical protein